MNVQPPQPLVSLALLVAASLLVSGCRSTGHETAEVAEIATEAPVESDHPRLDRWEWIIDTPQRWLPFKPPIQDSVISAATISRIEAELDEQELEKVHVVVNDYDPREHWHRLWSNTDVGIGWRATVGTATWLRTTILPPRVFDTNEYDRYSNTLYVNADRRFEILRELELARRDQARSKSRWRDLAVVLSLGPLSMPQRILAGRAVIARARETGDWETEREGLIRIYPEYAMMGMMVAMPVVPTYIAPVLGIGGGIVGHQWAMVIVRGREAERDRQESTNSASARQSLTEARGQN